MRYELECIFDSQTTDRRHFRTLYLGDVPYKPALGDQMVPYDFAQPLEVIKVMWDCQKNVWMIEAWCEADLNQLEADFKRTRTAYTGYDEKSRVT